MQLTLPKSREDVACIALRIMATPTTNTLAPADADAAHPAPPPPSSSPSCTSLFGDGDGTWFDTFLVINKQANSKGVPPINQPSVLVPRSGFNSRRKSVRDAASAYIKKLGDERRRSGQRRQLEEEVGGGAFSSSLPARHTSSLSSSFSSTSSSSSSATSLHSSSLVEHNPEASASVGSLISRPQSRGHQRHETSSRSATSTPSRLTKYVGDRAHGMFFSKFHRSRELLKLPAISPVATRKARGAADDGKKKRSLRPGQLQHKDGSYRAFLESRRPKEVVEVKAKAY